MVYFQKKEEQANCVSNDGGGGERVLWRLIESLKDKKNVDVVVYTGDTVPPETILATAKVRFGISVPPKTRFVYLKSRFLVEKRLWPRFTMLGQSLGSMVLGMEALFKECPDIYLDTMGYAFTYPIFSVVGGSKVACYVHYPTVSEDMLRNVAHGSNAVNNSKHIAASSWKTNAKIIYYRIFALLYRAVGYFSSLVMVNSSWTQEHITAIWKKESTLVFPPVDCKRLTLLPERNREPIIVSIGQFRKEKDHMLQLEAFHLLLKSLPVDFPKKKDLQLVMMGSVRKHKKGDHKRVERLTQRAKDLGIEAQVSIIVDAPGSTIHKWLSRASVGIHTMKDEHFGISIVELMAAAVVPVAHNTAGPKKDIVIPFNGKETGKLANTVDEFAQHLLFLITNPQETAKLQKNARDSVFRFSDEEFSSKCLECLEKILKKN